ncbi:hypothetical protein [Rhodococcus sp. H29-C3]|uniref:hypothetical protein n=1 Tax=Rhodococcus sp. H29-C3 TaxID=3046307 RepID=UPI0024BB60C7|nr:hypothetical protein [Rhodococcus sp. H29-C3]MDJ0360798.1 hypothetical protein [Rhodococcus sp. H29-C3]
MVLAREARHARTEADGWFERTSPGRTFRRVIEEIVAIELFDRAMTLAAKIFTSVLPVIIAATMFSGWDLVAHGIDDQFGFNPASGPGGSGGLQATDPSFATFGVVGLLMIVISGTSFARTLTRIYGKIWNMPPSGLNHAWRWMVVLFIVAMSVPLLGIARSVAELRFVGRPLALLVEFAVWLFVWVLTPHLLTGGWVSGRVLWATGALTAAGLTAFRAGGRVVLPRITETAEAQFGQWGLVFTSISWLFGYSVIIVGAAAVTKALALDEGPIGRVLRGPEPALVPESTDPSTPGDP